MSSTSYSTIDPTCCLCLNTFSIPVSPVKDFSFCKCKSDIKRYYCLTCFRDFMDAHNQSNTRSYNVKWNDKRCPFCREEMNLPHTVPSNCYKIDIEYAKYLDEQDIKNKTLISCPRECGWTGHRTITNATHPKTVREHLTECLNSKRFYCKYGCERIMLTFVELNTHYYNMHLETEMQQLNTALNICSQSIKLIQQMIPNMQSDMDVSVSNISMYHNLHRKINIIKNTIKNIDNVQPI